MQVSFSYTFTTLSSNSPPGSGSITMANISFSSNTSNAVAICVEWNIHLLYQFIDLFHSIDDLGWISALPDSNNIWKWKCQKWPNKHVSNFQWNKKKENKNNIWIPIYKRCALNGTRGDYLLFWINIWTWPQLNIVLILTLVYPTSQSPRLITMRSKPRYLTSSERTRIRCFIVSYFQWNNNNKIRIPIYKRVALNGTRGGLLFWIELGHNLM